MLRFGLFWTLLVFSLNSYGNDVHVSFRDVGENTVFTIYINHCEFPRIIKKSDLHSPEIMQRYKDRVIEIAHMRKCWRNEWNH
jgi:hypothetical protein